MGSALWAGISGLNASSKELDVIANNLANVNTLGYKSGTTYFSDVLSQSISGGSGTLQVGRGVAVAEVQTQFGSGSFETTGNATDAAIDGDGFFMVNNAEGGTFFTRAGAFKMDAAGVLVDTNGYKVQGHLIDAAGNEGPLSDLNLQNAQNKASTTTEFALGVNLNADTVTGGQYSTTQTVYDEVGGQHTLTTTFTRTDHTMGGYWGVQATLDSTAATTQSEYGLRFDGTGAMTGVYTGTEGVPVVVSAAGGAVTATSLARPGMVYQNGSIVLTCNATPPAAGTSWSVSSAQYTKASIITAESTATTLHISLDGTGTNDLTFTLNAAANWAATNTITTALTYTSAATNDIQITFPSPLPGTITNVQPAGASIGVAGAVTWNILGDGSLPMTQYAAPSVIRSLTADGYASGDLKTLSIDEKGRVSGYFTNGQTTDLAQLILARFHNPWGLKKMGNNLFGKTLTSGEPIENAPGQAGMGSLSPNSVEMSNTDIATEFIKMITAQKAYQACARVVTTEDTIMQELMNLKR